MFKISYKRFATALFLLTGLIIVFYLWKIGYLSQENIVSFLKLHPFLAPFLFLLINVLMIIFLLPMAFPMAMAAGFLWGWFWGGIIVIFSTSIGAAVCFFISRYLAYDYLNKKFKGKIYSSLQEEIKTNDWKVIAFTRNSPIFPFGIASYFFGLTPISFKRYFWSTILAVAPGTWVISALGNYVGNIAVNGEASNVVKIIFIIGVFITGLFILWCTRRIYTRLYKPKFSEIKKENQD